MKKRDQIVEAGAIKNLVELMLLDMAVAVLANLAAIPEEEEE